MPSTVHNAVYKDLIDRLIAARKAAGLTQQAVADSLGKPQSFVAKFEGLERRLDVVEFLQIAAVIHWDPMPVMKKVWTAAKAK